ncbi:hypothetical protein F4813DRAFT_398506 [Daldinia decipiens]|uniref:uncharacterized protein n=1 Tax=Daldinia decipiens TaxID=326647 RepID=UPI0020C426D1|nr:uncharacterized protein F4813DRAFT_398506 [Daldinia decipiens]KAI1655411.1 hypothetical protein F4813DRAFT_398506 [Daldinia decipiens]
MTSDICLEEIRVSSQEDIDNLNCSCGDDSGPYIYITNFTDKLDFPHCLAAELISIYDSPRLKEISFPDLDRLPLPHLLIRDATELKNVSLPHLNSDFQDHPGLSLDFLGIPKLKNITFGNITNLAGVNLTNSVLDEYTFFNITSVDNLIVEGIYDFENLRSVETLQLIGRYYNPRAFLNVTSLQNLTFTNTIDSTPYFVDNANTTLPWFPRLQRANNIHIRGYIDTSPGPNIFPALTAVSGNVTIEAWNDDFNCSKLVDQYQNGLIHNLACNGTNNVTGPNMESSPQNASSELSQGAWAGIGTGIGIFVICTVLGMIWLLLRLRRWREELMGRIRQQEVQQDYRRDSLEMEHEPPNLNILFESDGTGIIREKPDDHLREAGGEVVIAEQPDDHIRELPVPPAELEGAPGMEIRI